jgi:hypothetical protein
MTSADGGAMYGKMKNEILKLGVRNKKELLN